MEYQQNHPQLFFAEQVYDLVRNVSQIIVTITERVAQGTPTSCIKKPNAASIVSIEA